MRQRQKSQGGKLDTVRLTIDFSSEQHAYLKMLAARNGVSMRQYVVEALGVNVDKEKERLDLSENKFKRSMKKVIEENDDVLRRLADR